MKNSFVSHAVPQSNVLRLFRLDALRREKESFQISISDDIFMEIIMLYTTGRIHSMYIHIYIYIYIRSHLLISSLRAMQSFKSVVPLSASIAKKAARPTIFFHQEHHLPCQKAGPSSIDIEDDLRPAINHNIAVPALSKTAACRNE